MNCVEKGAAARLQLMFEFSLWDFCLETRTSDLNQPGQIDMTQISKRRFYNCLAYFCAYVCSETWIALDSRRSTVKCHPLEVIAVIFLRNANATFEIFHMDFYLKNVSYMSGQPCDWYSRNMLSVLVHWYPKEGLEHHPLVIR